MFAQFTDIFVLDSLPTPICQYSRAGRSNLCATEQIKPELSTFVGTNFSEQKSLK